MCGIAGFIGFNEVLNLCNMANQIQLHRGPDSQDKWLGKEWDWLIKDFP